MNGHLIKKKKKKQTRNPRTQNYFSIYKKQNGKIHLSNIGRGKLNGRKKKKNKQTNMLSTWVVSILVQNFIPYFQSNFLLILERLSFDGLRKEKKKEPHHPSLPFPLSTKHPSH